MDDERLSVLLLEPGASTVVLVGQPVFRLSEQLNLTCNKPEFSAVVPQINKVERIEQHIEANLNPERNLADCVMLLDLPTDVDDPENVLGLACRASPQLLIVEQTSSEMGKFFLADEQFFAFGFRIVKKIAKSGVHRALYAYTLKEYKQAPDWLNARFWAHPERFDQLE